MAGDFELDPEKIHGQRARWLRRGTEVGMTTSRNGFCRPSIS